jgi:hypothetical protein
MNPILLKPSSDTGAQVIVHGKAIGSMQATKYHETLILEQTFDAGRLSDTGEPRGGPAEEVSPTVLQRYCTDQHTL